MRFGIVELYSGKSGKIGFYNNQEIGLARSMKKLGYDVFVFYPQKNRHAIEEEILEDKITVVYTPALVIGNHAKYKWDVLIHYKIDIVQLGADNQLFAPNLLSYCDRQNIRAYNLIGTTSSDSENWLKRLIMYCFFKRNIRAYKSHKNFAKTYFVKNQLEEKNIKNVDIAHVGLDMSIIPDLPLDKIDLRRELKIDSEKTVLLFVGRLDKYKRPQMMIELIDSLPSKYMGVIIGDGELSSEIESSISNNRLNDRILWIKQVPNREVHKYYKATDYFLNFNDHEIFGMSILEAMYQGCNVIAFHAPGPNEIIENGRNGILVNSMKEMRSVIAEDRKIHCDSIRQRIEEHFTWDNTACIFDDWIKKNI